eukprot:901086-Pleurochrysis_carterae.AAC.1
MPITASDKAGNNVHLTLKNVRCVPSFPDSLLSVNALWEASQSECRFANDNSIFTSPTAEGGHLVLPFRRTGGLFEWRVVTRPSRAQDVATVNTQRCYAIHASRTHHHIG